MRGTSLDRQGMDMNRKVRKQLKIRKGAERKATNRTRIRCTGRMARPNRFRYNCSTVALVFTVTPEVSESDGLENVPLKK
jgi:hypothetical protein